MAIMSNRGVIQSVVRAGLFQGGDFTAVRAVQMQSIVPASQLSDTGQAFRDSSGNLLAMCDVDFLDNAICGP